MSAISTNPSSLAAGGSASNAFNQLNSEEFVKIILTELTNQDPLKPSDSSALVEQMASLRSIESDMALGNKLETLVAQNQLSSAAGLLGKLVTGINDANQRVVGYVESVSRTDQGAILNISDGSRVPLDNVDEMLDPGLFEPRTPGGDEDDTDPDPPPTHNDDSNSPPPSNSNNDDGEPDGGGQ